MSFERSDIEIVFEDSAVLVVNKPSGLPVLGERWVQEAIYLVDILKQTWPDLVTAHRIDKETSGLVLCAKNPEIARALEEQFRLGQVDKSYMALLGGTMGGVSKLCELPLRLDGDRQHRTVVDKRGGVEAKTLFTVKQRFRHHTLVEATIFTGRTHQIRAHAQALGFPLVGDSLYGGRDLYLSACKPNWRGDKETERPLLSRVALHAAYLKFNHPVDAREIVCNCPPPRDLETAILQLQKHSR